MTDDLVAAVEFRLLGPVEVRCAGRGVDIGHARQRCVLAALLVEAGEVVPTATLIDRVWGHDPPESALNGLYSYLTRLRKALAPLGILLRRRSGGYLLEVAADMVDVNRFREEVARSDPTASPAAVAAQWDAALAMWRGIPLADLAGPWATSVRKGLQDEWLAAQVARNEAYLRCGRHTELVTPLREAVEANPNEERLVGQLMLALYRSGRVSEAREQYRLTRQGLTDRHGSAPSPALRALHQRILRDDPTLTQVGTPTQAGLPTPAGLPPDLPGFVGRRAEIAALDRLLSGANHHTLVISAVDGTAGVGKTALAVRWAHRVKTRFPDGNLYANLHGHGQGPPADPAGILDSFLAALDVTPQRIPLAVETKTALFRSLLEDRRMLILLDNAASAEQVRPLLPAAPGCLVIVTSRTQLTGLVAVDGAHPMTVDLFSGAEARQLLVDRLGAQRIAGEPQAVEDLITRCARLPLALAVMAARAARSGFPLGTLADELAATGDRLDALSAGDAASEVRAVLSWSYAALPHPAARLFRLLGLHPGPDIAIAAVASVAAQPRSTVGRLLAELTRASLLSEPVRGRFTWHDLLRAYATEQCSARERHGGLLRIVDHYLHTARAADQLLNPHRDPPTLAFGTPGRGVTPERFPDAGCARAWLTAEHRVLLAVIRLAADRGLESPTWQLAWSVDTFLDYQGHWQDQATAWQLALDAVGDNQAAQAYAHRLLGRAHTRLGGYDDAHTHYRLALKQYAQIGDRAAQAHTHQDLSYLCEREGRLDQALAHDRRALTLARAAGHRRGQAYALNGIGWCHALLGDHRKALVHCAWALALHKELGDRWGEADTWDSLGYAHHHLGDQGRATDCYENALDLNRALGDRYGEATTLTNLGDAQHAGGDPGAARAAWLHALDILDDLDHPDATEVRRRLLR